MEQTASNRVVPVTGEMAFTQSTGACRGFTAVVYRHVNYYKGYQKHLYKYM